MSKKNIGLIVGVILIVVGLLLFVPTEPAGQAGDTESGGTGSASGESEETRPFFWHGVVVLVIGFIVTAFAWLKGDDWDAT